MILWTKDGDPKILHRGEVLMLYNVGYQQKGYYYCEASNSIGNITAKSHLLINRELARLYLVFIGLLAKLEYVEEESHWH